MFSPLRMQRGGNGLFFCKVLVKLFRKFFMRRRRNSSMTLFFLSAFFLVFGVEFRKTKQIVVAPVTATFKPLLSVAKTNGRLSGREFYAGNIDNLFRNMLAHIFSYQHKKVRQPKSAHRKTPTPIVAKQSLHSIGSLYNQAGVALLPKRGHLII